MRCESPAPEPVAGTPATPPTSGPRTCCANTATPARHRAAQIDSEHLSADLVVALGRNHVRMLREMGVPAEQDPDAAVI